jgi:hypothetical protein
VRALRWPVDDVPMFLHAPQPSDGSASYATVVGFLLRQGNAPVGVVVRYPPDAEDSLPRWHAHGTRDRPAVDELVVVAR